MRQARLAALAIGGDRRYIFCNHPGPMKVLTTITLRSSHKLLRVGSIRSPAALPPMAVRGRAFLSEHANDIRIRYYKGGLAEGVTRRFRGRQTGGFRFANYL